MQLDPEDQAFFEQMEGLELEGADDEAIDYETMTVQQLLDRQIEIETTLKKRLALLYPQTPEDQDLQTQYYAIKLELARRHQTGG